MGRTNSATRCIRLGARIVVEGAKDDKEKERIEAIEHRALLLARDDMRLTANRTITELYVRTRKPPEPGAPKVALHTQAYRLISGVHGETSTYEPTQPENRVSGGVRSAVATHVYQRLSTDLSKIKNGETSLATFRRLPLLVRKQEVTIRDHETVELLFYGRPKPRRVRFHVWPCGRHSVSTWRAIVGGTLSSGDVRLQLDRKGRWFILLSHSILTPDPRVDGGVLGVEISPSGLQGVVLQPTGDLDFETFPPPCHFWRLWARDLDIRRQIGRANRLDYDLRGGRGRAKKLKPFDRLREKYRLRVLDACRVMAAALARYAAEAGVRAVALAKLKGEVEKQQDRTEDVVPRETRAEMRSKFLRQNKGQLDALIRTACEGRGIKVLAVSGAKRYLTCAECGEKGEMRSGDFTCMYDACKRRGKRTEAARNTALVLARRGEAALSAGNPAGGESARLVAQPEAEEAGGRAGGESLGQAPERSASSSVDAGESRVDGERPESEGSGGTENRDSRTPGADEPTRGGPHDP